MSRWYRAYEGTVTDAKLGEAALIAEVSRSVSIAAWHCLLESAAGRNNCGSYDATPRRIAVILCEPLSNIEGLFLAFEELGLISDGAVASWKRRQYESDSSTERSRKHRERHRNGNATLQKHDATPPETETETEEKSTNVDSSAKPTEKPLTADEIVEAWNTRMVPQGFPAVRRLTDARRKSLKARLRENTIDDWQQAMSALERSEFCRGHGPNGWVADFDFLLQPKSFTKLLEGAYDH